MRRNTNSDTILLLLYYIRLGLSIRNYIVLLELRVIVFIF